MKIIISFLILSFAHLIYAEDFYVGNWKPSEANCDSNALREKKSTYECVVIRLDANNNGETLTKRYNYKGSRGMSEVRTKCRSICSKKEIGSYNCKVINVTEIPSIYNRGNTYREEKCEERKLAKIKEKEERSFKNELARFLDEDWKPSNRNCRAESLSKKGPGTVYKCTIEESIRIGKRKGEPKPIKISLVEQEHECSCPDHIREEFCRPTLQPFETLYSEKNIGVRQSECVAWKLGKESEKQLAHMERQIEKGQNQCRVEQSIFENKYAEAKDKVSGVFVGKNNTQDERFMQAVNNVLNNVDTDEDRETVEGFCRKKKNKEKLLCLEEEKKKLEQKIVDTETDLLNSDIIKIRERVHNHLAIYNVNLNSHTKNQSADDDLRSSFHTIMKNINNEFENLIKLESNQIQACQNRYEQYDQIRNSCYNKGMEVAIEARNEHYNSLNLDLANISNVFSYNFTGRHENIFTQVLNKAESSCLRDKVGTELRPFSCNLEALEKRVEFCEEYQGDTQDCPSTQAKNIQQETINSLVAIKKEKDNIKTTLDNLYEELDTFQEREELSIRGKERLGNIIGELKDAKDNFFNEEQKENYPQMVRDHHNVQLMRFDKLSYLENKIKRKKLRDPVRNLAERWRFANELCCQPVASLDLPYEKEQVNTLGEKQLGSTSFCTALNEHTKNPQLVQLMSFPVPSILTLEPSEGVVAGTSSSKSGGSRN